MATESSDEVRATLAKLASLIASQMSVTPLPPPAPAKYDPDQAHRFIRTIPGLTPTSERALMTFAGWLWKTGTHDMGKVLAIVEDRVRRNPHAPYSYYASGGQAREAKEAAWAIDFAARENARFKSEDRRFLSQDSDASP